MSVARISEISSTSTQSFEDAIRQGIERATQTVRGYVVGQPTATNTVVRSSFPNDYALAIADAASTTSTSSMLYVQIPSAFRSQWGLRTNPSLMGKQIDVTGALSAYFSHPGMTSTSAFALAGGGTTEPPPTGGTSRNVIGIHAGRSSFSAGRFCSTGSSSVRSW